VQAVVDRKVPLTDAAEGHRALESGDHVGKVLLIAPGHS
jgi:NADPH:quinone reductase-like Zn-dependent oxidoreductase